MDMKIEKNIPVPEGRNDALYTKMEVGDSVLGTPDETMKFYSSATSFSNYKKKGWKFSRKKVENGKYRVWRIA